MIFFFCTLQVSLWPFELGKLEVDRIFEYCDLAFQGWAQGKKKKPEMKILGDYYLKKMQYFPPWKVKKKKKRNSWKNKQTRSHPSLASGAIISNYMDAFCEATSVQFHRNWATHASEFLKSVFK